MCVCVCMCVYVSVFVYFQFRLLGESLEDQCRGKKNLFPSDHWHGLHREDALIVTGGKGCECHLREAE